MSKTKGHYETFRTEDGWKEGDRVKRLEGSFKEIYPETEYTLYKSETGKLLVADGRNGYALDCEKIEEVWLPYTPTKPHAKSIEVLMQNGEKAVFQNNQYEWNNSRREPLSIVAYRIIEEYPENKFNVGDYVWHVNDITGEKSQIGVVEKYHDDGRVQVFFVWCREHDSTKTFPWLYPEENLIKVE